MASKASPTLPLSTASPAAVDAAKCPISGQEAKNGQTCAYDPTKMSFWQSKAVAAALPKPAEIKLQSSDECPMRSGSSTAANAGSKPVNSADTKYKNPNQYNVS